MRGEDGELHQTSWEHALESRGGGPEGGEGPARPAVDRFLASARLTMEENYLIQKLGGAVMGTNSVHSCEAT